MQTFSHSQVSNTTYLFNSYAILKSKGDSLHHSDNYLNNINVNKVKQVFKQSKSQNILSQKIEPRFYERNDLLNSIVVLELILSFVLLSLVIVRSIKYLKIYIQSLYYDFIAEKTLSNISVPLKKTARILDFLLLISTSLLTYLFINTLMPVNKIVMLYSLIAAPLIVYFYRGWIWFFHKILGIVTADHNVASMLSFKNNLVFRLVGVFLLPVIFIAIYVRTEIQVYLVYLPFVILLILLLHRYIFFVRMFIKQRISILYFILYLCALELPIILGVIYSYRMF